MRSQRASSPRANSRKPRPPFSSGAFSASPLASTATVSLVDWSPSTVIRLNDRSTLCLRACRSTGALTTASVVTKQNIVAMCGSIIPDPLATAPMRHRPSADLQPQRRLLGRGCRWS